MSLSTQINSLITRIGTEFKSTKNLIAGNSSGDLSGLITSAKTSLVAAINELKSGYNSINTVVNHNKGWYATSAALILALPSASAGDYAIVGATDTVWIWDTDGTPAWKDSGAGGAVTSVNGSTGAVVIPQVTVSVDGLMIAADKVKLNGLTNYTHPTGDGGMHVPATGTVNNLKVLKAGATAGSGSWDFVAFSELTSKPTDIAGYGITNAYTKTEIGDPTTDFVAAFNIAIA